MSNDFHSPIDPVSRNAVARRILQVTDEDETIIPEFIDLNPLNAGRAP
jgi:hypothetical protein